MNFIGNIVNLIYSMALDIKSVILALSVIGILIGAGYSAVGGTEGAPKAKKWFIGGGFGVVAALCAKSFVEFLQSKITF